MKFLSLRGVLRAEESLFSWVSIKERFFASLGMTKNYYFRSLFSRAVARLIAVRL
jgi:hypothetical protein